MEPDISIVIPVYNEAGNIIPLYHELQNTLKNFGSSFEIIFINDGSADSTLEELQSLKNIRIINLGKNRGQSAGFTAGFKEVRGSIVVTLDGDGQNDPTDIPLMIEKLKKENLDVVAGWRKHRRDPVHIVLISYVGRMMRFLLFHDKINDSGCSLRVYRKEVVHNLTLTDKMHRFILIIFKLKGFKIGEMIVNHRPRLKGKSKYNAIPKIFKGTSDLLTLRFGEELITTTAISFLSVTIILMIYCIYLL